MATAAPQSVDDLIANCAKEPIHIPGGIQPHGFLFSVDDDGMIAQASENSVELSGTAADAIVGAPLE